ncbi:MAG: hypothetical protein LQ349_001310 [Xanthoria aureola]|nr:MAG: hypothetical protein LQ349_001310 [Xanthoria aureola]
MANFANLPPGIDLSQVASQQPPPGVEPNFVTPESTASTAIAVTVLFTVIMFIFVCMRVYTKLFVSRAKGWDDYTCILACLCSWAYMGVCVNVFKRGYTVHVWDLPISKLTKSLLETLNVASAFYGPAMFFTKLSIFILYYRILNPSRTMRYLIYFGIGFNFIYYTIYLFIYSCYCPNTSKKAPTCSHEVKVISVATSAINVVSDFYILLIPLAAISNLQLPKKRKLGLFAIFFTGFLACLCSIISLHYRVVLVRTRDDVWYVVPVLVISTVEFNIGIICSCLPTLPALFRRSTRPSKRSYNPDSGGVSGSGHAAGAGGGVAAAAGSGGAGGSKQGFGRLHAAGSQDSVAALEAGRREGDGSEGGFEMRGVGEEDERKREWFRQARM